MVNLSPGGYDGFSLDDYQPEECATYEQFMNHAANMQNDYDEDVEWDKDDNFHSNIEEFIPGDIQLNNIKAKWERIEQSNRTNETIVAPHNPKMNPRREIALA